MRYFSRSYHTIIRTFSKKMRGMKLTKKMLFSKKSVASLVMAGILAGVIIFFYFNSSGLRAKAAWFNDHWMYRKAYTIDNTGSAQTNKKIKLDIDTSSLISGGKMQSSCQDSRFTTASGQTIPYYRFDAPASGTATFVDDTEYTSSTSGTTETFSHTVSEGDDRYLVVAISMLRSHSLGIRDQTKDIFVTSMYYGDQRMIRLVADNNNDTNRNRSVELWGLVNPDVGTHDISVTITPHNNRWVISAMNFTGVDQLDPTGGWGANATSSAVSTLSASVTTESANSLIVGTGYIQNDDGGTLSLATGTETFEQSTGVSGVDLRANGGYRTTTTAGAYTFQVDATGSQQMGVAAVELKNATGDFSNINLVNISRYDADNLASTTGSFDHQVPTDVEDPVLVVFVHAFTANSNAHLNDINLNTLTYNGDSMTEQVAYDHSSTNRRGYFAIWTLPNPDEGLNTLSLTFNITVFDVEAFAITYSGVNQSTPVGGTNSAGAGAGVASVSTSVSTSYANSLLVGSGFWSTTNSQTTSSGDYSTVTVKNDETLFQGATDIKTDYPLSVGGGQRVTSSTGSYDFQLDFSNGTTSTTFAAVVAAELNPATNRTSSDACGGSSTDYQLLMDSIPAGKSVIYHYYGNPTVGNISKISGFTQSLFTPNSTTAGSEQQSPGPLVYFKLDEGVDNSCPNGGDACSSASATYNGAKAGAVWESNSCVSGSCLYFDDDQDYFEAISGTTGTDSFEVDEFTVSAWVKATDSPNIDGGVVINTYGWNGSSAAQRGWYLGDSYGSDDLLELRIYDSSGNSAGAAYSGFYAEHLNEWVYVTGVYSNSGDYVKLYINGELYSSTSSTVVLAHNSSARHLRVGARSDTTSQGEWEGYLDEVKFFTYARTADEIKADYNSLSSKGAAANFGADTQRSLSDGLIGYWKFDEGSWNGTAGELIDHSGNGNNGTSYNTIGTTSGKFGGAPNLDGSADYFDIPYNQDLQLQQNFTISAWIYSDVFPTSLSPEYRDMIYSARDKDSPNNGLGYMISGSDCGGEAKMILMDGGGSPTATFSTDCGVIQEDTWHFVSVTYDDDNNIARHYVDGQMVAENTSYDQDFADSSDAQDIGRQRASLYEFDGYIDELRIYDRALSPAEVAALYKWAPGPFAHYKFDENTGTTTSYDSSGYGNNATLTSITESSWVPGKYGSAINYDGSADYASFTVENTTPARGTLAMWVKPDFDMSSGTGTYIAFSADAYGSAGSMNLAFRPATYNDIVFYIVDDSGGSWPTNYHGAEWNSPSWSAGEWKHLAITWESVGDCQNKIYVDGVLTVDTCAGTDSGYTFTLPTTAYIGQEADNTNRFDGTIDDVRLYDYILTESQITNIINARTPGQTAVGSPISSPVGHWKFDEGYGTTANDSSGQSNNFTLSAANWTNNGKYGKAFNGDGAAYASMSDNATYDITASSDYSISLWFQSDSASNPGTTEYLINKANATTAGYAVYANTSGYLCFGIDDDATWNPDISSCTTTDYYDSTWHHLVAVRDSGGSDKTYVYIDGVLKDSDSDTTTATLANSLSLYLADRDGTNNGDEFNGQLDDVKIYNYALTGAEVAADYNQAKTASFGTLSTASDGTTADNSATRSFCVPGDTTSCNPPVLEYKFDENTGTTSTYDTSGNGYTGTLTSITSGSWVPGAYGSALQFDGSADYVSVPGTPLNTSQSTGTISAWVKPLDATDTEGIFSTLENRDRYMFIDGSTFKASMYDGTGATFRILSGGTVDTNWHFITFSWDIGNGSLKFYVDGVLADSYSGSSWTTAGTASGTYLARSTSANSNMPATDYFEGSIDQFIIYDYVRTPAQIAWEYNRGAPIAHYKFDECQGTTIYNSAVTGRDTVAGYNLIPTIGASGTNTSLGTCSSGTGTEAWNNGTTGKYGASMSFDGTDDRGEYTNSQNLTSRFTISAWVKSDDFTPQMYVYEIEYGLPALVTANNYIRITMRDAGNTTWNNYNSSAVLNDGEWNHIAVTYDTPNIVHYINGVPVGTGSHTGPMGGWASTNNTWVGGRSSVWFDGQIDDVQVYNYALTATQVRNLMNRGAVSFK